MGAGIVGCQAQGGDLAPGGQIEQAQADRVVAQPPRQPVGFQVNGQYALKPRQLFAICELTSLRLMRQLRIAIKRCAPFRPVRWLLHTIVAVWDSCDQRKRVNGAMRVDLGQ